MDARSISVVEALSLHSRVVILGGNAVIFHGFSRPTTDSDIWLEPELSSQEWAAKLNRVLREIPSATIHRLPHWTEIQPDQLSETIEEVGMIRVLGLDEPLDVFRVPNEFEPDDFDAVISRATREESGSYIPDPIDLIQSKLETGRDKDARDIAFLEDLVSRRYCSKLPTASLAEVEKMLARYSDFRVLESALTNPDPAVQKLAKGQLQEFADQGDPFSLAILEGREIPPAS